MRTSVLELVSYTMRTLAHLDPDLIDGDNAAPDLELGLEYQTRGLGIPYLDTIGLGHDERG